MKPKDKETKAGQDGLEMGNVGNAKPISLYPLTPKEALRRALATPPPPKPDGLANKAKNVRRR